MLAEKYKSLEEFIKSQGVFLYKRSLDGLSPVEETKRHLRGSIKETEKTIKRLKERLSSMSKGKRGLKVFLKDRIAFEKRALNYFRKELNEILKLESIYNQAKQTK